LAAVPAIVVAIGCLETTLVTKHFSMLVGIVLLRCYDTENIE